MRFSTFTHIMIKKNKLFFILKKCFLKTLKNKWGVFPENTAYYLPVSLQTEYVTQS